MSQHPSNNHPNNMNEELFQQNTSTPVQSSSAGVDKSIWDMYQYLLQHGSGNSQAINQKVSYGVNALQTAPQPLIDKSQLLSTNGVEQFSSQQVASTLQQPNTSPLDQLLALNNYVINNNGALITPSPFQQQLNSTVPHHQQNVSPILVVINNNSHNTSLNHLHHNNTTASTSGGSLSSSPTTSNTSSACSPLNNIQLVHAQQQQQLSNNVPMYFKSSSNPSSNFYQYMEESGQGVENHQVKSTMKQPHGIQKTHKMISKLPPSHVSISSIPSQSNNNSNSSSPASSSNYHDPTTTNMQQQSDSQSGSKFSRPLLKNETVLCEKNPKFKQNYFVFEKKKEKTPISFHNISVSEIISGEVSTPSPKVEARIITKASSSPQPNSSSSSSRKKKLNNLLNKESPTGNSSISGSSHSQPMLSMMIGNNKSTNSILHHRMTHSPNTNDSNHGQQFKILPNSSQSHTLMNPTLVAPSQQCVSSRLSPQSTPSNVMNVLLNNGNLPIISNNLNNMLEQNNQYLPINTFDTTTSTDALLANLPPVVESLFHQQTTNTSNNTTQIGALSTNTSNMMMGSTETTPLNSNDDLLFDDFIVQEDLNSLGMSSTSSVFQQQGLNEFTPEQWSDLLQYMINRK